MQKMVARNVSMAKSLNGVTAMRSWSSPSTAVDVGSSTGQAGAFKPFQLHGGREDMDHPKRQTTTRLPPLGPRLRPCRRECLFERGSRSSFREGGRIPKTWYPASRQESSAGAWHCAGDTKVAVSWPMGASWGLGEVPEVK